MKVYFVRHGQSEGNVLGIHQTGETKLSQLGIKQAENVGRRLKNVGLEVIFASDFTRAKQTSEIINQQLNLEIITTPLLREVKRPTEVEGKTFGDPQIADIKSKIYERRHDPAWRFSDEENFFDRISRAKKFITELESRAEEKILCVAHGTIMRHIFMLMMIGDNYTPDIFEQIKRTMNIKNTGVTICEFKNNEWRVLTLNDYTHLD